MIGFLLVSLATSFLWHLTPFPPCLMNIPTAQGLPPPFVKKRSHSFVLYYETILYIQLIKPNWHRPHERFQIQNWHLIYYIPFQRITIDRYSFNSSYWLFYLSQVAWSFHVVFFNKWLPFWRFFCKSEIFFLTNLCVSNHLQLCSRCGIQMTNRWIITLGDNLRHLRDE
jgi:hypothetical protein